MIHFPENSGFKAGYNVEYRTGKKRPSSLLKIQAVRGIIEK